METAFVESSQCTLQELNVLEFLRIKEAMYEMGLKKDVLTIETILRRNFMIKKNLRM